MGYFLYGIAGAFYREMKQVKTRTENSAETELFRLIFHAAHV